MEINKLLGILRAPHGIASDVVKEARLEAADIVERDYKISETRDLLLNPVEKKCDSCKYNDNVCNNPDLCEDYDQWESLLPNKIEEPFGEVIYEGVNKIHIQEGLSEFDKDDFKGAPKNHILEGKHDMSELPLDLLAELLCPAYQEGTHFKYYRNSWRKGFKMSVMFAACLRHLTKFFFMREDYDQETLEKYGIKKHHLGAAMFCIVALYNDWKNYPENDDRRKVK